MGKVFSETWAFILYCFSSLGPAASTLLSGLPVLFVVSCFIFQSQTTFLEVLVSKDDDTCMLFIIIAQYATTVFLCRVGKEQVEEKVFLCFVFLLACP